MGSLRTYVGSVLFSALIATQAWAEPGLDRRFAECIGRYSAEREHAWLLGDRDADALERQRQAFLALLDAATRSETPRQILAYRIEVKMAHASLLTQASFGTDSVRADRARRLAAGHIGSCQSLLLGG